MVESSSVVCWLRSHWQFGGRKLIGCLVVERSSAVWWLRAHRRFGG